MKSNGVRSLVCHWRLAFFAWWVLSCAVLLGTAAGAGLAAHELVHVGKSWLAVFVLTLVPAAVRNWWQCSEEVTRGIVRRRDSRALVSAPASVGSRGDRH